MIFREQAKQILVFSLFVLLSIPFKASSEIIVIDDKNNKIILTQPANRIISLAPHITESLYAAGAGHKIVGAVSYSDYPEAAKNIPRVGGYPSADMEKIISLKPDLIIAWHTGNNLKQIEKLISLGYKVFVNETLEIENIPKTIQKFGFMAGTEKIAAKEVTEFNNNYLRLKNNYSKKKKVKVFYQIWNKPLMTINGKHIISKIINLCGGVNISADTKSMTPKVSFESVIAGNPEVIVAGGMDKVQPEWANEWLDWPQISAVNKERVYFIDPSLLQRVGPRILQGANQLCKLLDEARPEK